MNSWNGSVAAARAVTQVATGSSDIGSTRASTPERLDHRAVRLA